MRESLFVHVLLSAIVTIHRSNIPVHMHVMFLQQHPVPIPIICQFRIHRRTETTSTYTSYLSLSQIHPSRSNISLRSSLASLSGSISAMILHISRAILSLFLHTMPLFFHSFSIFSRSLAVTYIQSVIIISHIPKSQGETERE
jgi:hypothetical protein